MRNKKLRGLKRKTRNMINRIGEETSDFPLDFYNGYWHLHLPAKVLLIPIGLLLELRDFVFKLY